MLFVLIIIIFCNYINGTQVSEIFSIADFHNSISSRAFLCDCTINIPIVSESVTLSGVEEETTCSLCSTSLLCMLCIISGILNSVQTLRKYKEMLDKICKIGR